MWILALAKHLNPDTIRCRLAVTKESDSQNLEICRRFEALGLDALKIPMRGRFNPTAVVKLAGFIRQHGIDIVHTHGYKSDILGLMAARLTGVKVVATPHGFENVDDFKLRTFIRMGNLTLKFFDKVAPLSAELAVDMHRIGVPSDRIVLIKNGVDLDEIGETGIDQHFGDDDWVKRIGYVGQLAYRKNLKDLLLAFDRIWRKRRDIELVLVGDGPMRGELKEMARQMACASRIRFLGYRSDRLSLMRSFDIFAMTSSLEGIPRCMMEAMALGLPVVAFDISGVDQLIIHEKTGLLAPFGDVEAMSRAMECLLYDQELAETLAQQGREHVHRNFSAKRMADEYTDLYEELVFPQN